MVDRKSSGRASDGIINRGYVLPSPPSFLPPSLFSLHTPTRTLALRIAVRQTSRFRSGFLLSLSPANDSSLTSILYRTGNYRIRVIHANPSARRATNYCRARGTESIHTCPLPLRPLPPPPRSNAFSGCFRALRGVSPSRLPSLPPSYTYRATACRGVARTAAATIPVVLF